MTGWVPLPVADADASVWRGSVFRCKGAWPYEPVVDFLLVHTHEVESEFAMLVATGAKAGILFQILPTECRTAGREIAVSMGWLQREWCNWIYPDCPPDHVWFAPGYPAPGELP